MTRGRTPDELSLPERAIRKMRTELARRTVGSPRRWRTGDRAVSFTFDDFPVSAAVTGAAILERFGMQGTFYASLGLVGEDSQSGVISEVETVQRVAGRGHEIGCHTFSHLDCSMASRAEIDADCAENRRVAGRHGLATLASFAYPFGGINADARREVVRAYQSARTVWPGINRETFDAGALRAVPLMRRDGPEVAFEHLRQLENGEGWLVFYTHDIEPEPSMFGCTPSLFEQVCERVRAIGADVLTVTAAMGRSA